MRDREMRDRAEKFIKKLNNNGWNINEHMIDQFVIFARSECIRLAVADIKTEIKKQVDLVNYKER